MPPYAVQEITPTLHREFHNDLSLPDASLSKSPNERRYVSLNSDTIRTSNTIGGYSTEASIPYNDKVPLKKAEETKDNNNDNNNEQDPSPSWIDRFLDCFPCTAKAANPVPAATKEHQCSECGRTIDNPTTDYLTEIKTRTVTNEETGKQFTVKETLYFMPSCYETRKHRNFHKVSYYLVLAELQAHFIAKRRREKEARRQARAEEKGKAKARAQASAKAVRTTRVEAQANATFTRKRKEAERSAALLKLASLAQESAGVARQRQEDEKKRKEAERYAAAAEYEATLANALAQARAKAWAKDAEYAAWAKEEESARKQASSSTLAASDTTEGSRDHILKFSPKSTRPKFSKRAKKALKKVLCHSNSKKVDNYAETSDEGAWKETVDSKSGKTYYYHTKTRETTWKKPKGYVQQEMNKIASEKTPWQTINDAHESAFDSPKGEF